MVEVARTRAARDEVDATFDVHDVSAPLRFADASLGGPTYMSLTVATIVNSALPLVSAACRAMLLCLAKGILLTFLASLWVLDWNGDGAKVGQAGRAARASH